MGGGASVLVSNRFRNQLRLDKFQSVNLLRRGRQSSNRVRATAQTLTGWSGEIDPLVSLIYLRLLGREADRVDILKPDEVADIRMQVSAEQRLFVERRVAARLRWYAKTVNTINFVRDFISGTIAGGGIVIAGVSATHSSPTHGLSWQNWVAIALGVIVGVLGAIAPRLARGQQVERYRRGMNRLRAEAWRFATKRGQYAELDNVQTTPPLTTRSTKLRAKQSQPKSISPRRSDVPLAQLVDGTHDLGHISSSA